LRPVPERANKADEENRDVELSSAQREHAAIGILECDVSRLQNDFKNFDAGSIGEEIEGIVRARSRSRLNPETKYAHVSRLAR
jgi:hypothetical protein